MVLLPLSVDRADIVHALRRIAVGGLVMGAAGNVSARAGDVFLVSPTSLPYETLRAEDVSVVEPASGRLLDGAPPSSELPMHLTLLRSRADVGAVVHTHSPHATALGCVHDELPAVISELALVAGGAVPVMPYAPSGEAAFGDAVVAALGDDGRAVIVRNHGVVCVGRDLDDAVARAFAVEETARVYVIARMLGEPALLPAAEVERLRR